MATKFSSEEPTASAATTNPAAQVLMRQFGRLVTAIQHPVMLASELLSAGLINDALLDKILNASGMGNYERNAIILNAVVAQLKVEPVLFDTLLDVLENTAALPSNHGFADQLKCAYETANSRDLTTLGLGQPVSSGDAQIQDPTAYLLQCPVYKKHAEFLRDCYGRTHENKWPQMSVDTYFNLATVNKEIYGFNRSKANEFTRTTLHRGIDEILAHKEPIKMEDILKPPKGKSKVNCVLVEGPPGVGKSTFAWELCKQWDSIPDLKKFPLVILLKCRDKHVQEADRVEDLFCHDDGEFQQAIAKEVCSRSGEGVLFIIDGFDEFPAHLRRSSLLLDIMKGRKLPRSTVVITSRPSAMADLRTCTVDKHIEILGFTQKEIEEYASKAFTGQPQLLEDFHKYRKRNPAVKSMMYVPLNTAMVADVFLSEGEPLSTTMTELYEEMSVIILKRYLKANGQDELADEIPRKLKDLPPDILSHFLKLGEMAFEGVVNEDVIFNELPKGCKHFGFLNESPELFARAHQRKSYNFLHKSFQELFTAFHISMLPPSERKKVFLTHFKNEKEWGKNNFNEVWKFVAGLSSFEGIGWEEVKAKGTTEQLVTCLFESQDVAAGDSVLGEVDFCIQQSCSLFYAYASSWCVGALKCGMNVVINKGDSELQTENVEVYETFLSGVNSFKNQFRGSISTIGFGAACHPEERITYLMNLSPTILQRVSKLSLFVYSSDVPRAADLVTKMVGLKRFHIFSDGGEEADVVQLFHTLSLLVYLEELGVSFFKIGYANVEALKPLLAPDTGCIKTFEIRRISSMSPECEQLLFKTVFSPSSLECLKMWDADWSSPCDSLALLADNHNLKSIKVHYSKSSNNIAFLEAMTKNTSVKKLKIIPLHGGDTEALVKMLDGNTTLETLRANVSYIASVSHAKTCLHIINALKPTHTLKKLQFYSYATDSLEMFNLMPTDMDPRVVFE